MNPPLATNFANALECAYPDVQLAEAVCTEYANLITTAICREELTLTVFIDDSVLLMSNTEGIAYEFAKTAHAIEYLTKTPELARKLALNNLPKTK